MIISKFLSTTAIIFSLTILGAEAKPPAGSSDVSNHVNKGVEQSFLDLADNLKAIHDRDPATAGLLGRRLGLETKAARAG